MPRYYVDEQGNKYEVLPDGEHKLISAAEPAEAGEASDPEPTADDSED